MRIFPSKDDRHLNSTTKGYTFFHLFTELVLYISHPAETELFSGTVDVKLTSTASSPRRAVSLVCCTCILQLPSSDPLKPIAEEEDKPLTSS